MPYLALAFSKDSAVENVRRELIAKKMVECIANMKAVNTVRIYYKKAANKVC